MTHKRILLLELVAIHRLSRYNMQVFQNPKKSEIRETSVRRISDKGWSTGIRSAHRTDPFDITVHSIPWHVGDACDAALQDNQSLVFMWCVLLCSTSSSLVVRHPPYRGIRYFQWKFSLVSFPRSFEMTAHSRTWVWFTLCAIFSVTDFTSFNIKSEDVKCSLPAQSPSFCSSRRQYLCFLLCHWKLNSRDPEFPKARKREKQKSVIQPV
jgi:hypothetical protein